MVQTEHTPLRPQELVRLFVPFGLGYFISYLFRTVNAVIAPDLVADLALGPADLGLLTAAYFLAFAAFQLPLGLLLDRFGARRVESLLLLFAALGAVLFSQAETLSGLLVGRALIGLGVSACLMAAFKAYATWLPAERIPLANGVQMVSGGLGALAATTPVQMALEVSDWRSLFLLLGLLGLLAALVIFLVVPDAPQSSQQERLTEQMQGLKKVLMTQAFWRIAPWTCTAQATYLSIQGLWSGPWLRDVAGYDRAQVAGMLWWIALAMVCGYFFFGRLADRLAKRGIRPAQVAAVGMLLFVLVQLGLVLYPNCATWLWPLFGFSGTACILPYAVLAQIFPKTLIGRCNTSLNLLVFSCAFAAQWLVGAVLEFWPQIGSGYHPQGYAAALLTLIGLQGLAMLWYGLRGRNTSLCRTRD